MSYYKISTAVRDFFFNHPDINVVTSGRIDEVDLRKQTIFAAAHVNTLSCEVDVRTTSYTFQILLMDKVDVRNEDVKDLDEVIFRGNDNLHDVWNTLQGVLAEFYAHLNRGELHDAGIMIEEGSVSMDAFDDRFENGVAGWGMEITLTTPSDIGVC